jgi:hypothetical protein
MFIIDGLLHPFRIQFVELAPLVEQARHVAFGGEDEVSEDSSLVRVNTHQVAKVQHPRTELTQRTSKVVDEDMKEGIVLVLTLGNRAIRSKDLANVSLCPFFLH